MRGFLTLLIAVLCLCGPRYAIDHHERWITENAPPWAKRLLLGTSEGSTALQFDHLKFDFGHKAKGEKFFHSFPFRNAGAQPVRILRVIGNCGCVNGRFPKEPIAPGEEAELEFHIDSSLAKDTGQKRMTLTTDEPGGGGTVLAMEGDIHRYVQFTSPAPHTPLPGETWDEIIELRTDPKVKAVKVARIEGDHLSARLLPSGEGTHQLKVGITAPQKPGVHVGEVVIQCDLAEGSVEQAIPFSVVVPEPLMVQPSRVKLRPNTPAKLFITNHWVGRLKITETYCSSNDVEVIRVKETDRSMQLEVKLRPTAKAVPTNAVVWILTDQKDVLVKIPVE